MITRTTENRFIAARIINLSATWTFCSLFIYLRPVLNSQWPVTVSADTNNSSKMTAQDTTKQTTKNKENESVYAFNTQARVPKSICKFTNYICGRNASS